jgi:nitroreductase
MSPTDSDDTERSLSGQQVPESVAVRERFAPVVGFDSGQDGPWIPGEREARMEYEGFLELVKGRRTIRAIKPDPIDDATIEKLLEAARWAPTGFNMQPCEFVVVKDLKLRTAIQKIVDEYRLSDFFPMEATREEWQGSPWTPEGGDFHTALAPVFILVLGDTRRIVGLPMAARYSRQKGDSIFESSMAFPFMYMLLAAHALGLAAMPVSATKYPKVGGLVKHLLKIPDYLKIYDMLLVGESAMEGAPGAKLMRHLDAMVHYDRASDDEFMTDADVEREIVKLRRGNVGRHQEADRLTD